MDKDRVAGSAKDFAGKVEGAVGDMAGDAQAQAAGRAREAGLLGTRGAPAATTASAPRSTPPCGARSAGCRTAASGCYG